MAKKSKSITFTNATIDLRDMSIAEMKKDSVVVSSLQEVLEEWDLVEGITLILKRDEQCGGKESDEA